MDNLIVIPARYNSARLPGKPLIMIAGKTMLQRVCETAQQAAMQAENVGVLVATDDERILNHALSLGVQAVMTPSNCTTGSDRIIAAIQQLSIKPKTIINLQGDTPLTPVSLLTALLNEPIETVVTPVVQLSWQDLDSLREAKLLNPFSGTTAIVSSNNQALWFSKQIIPALRNEQELRLKSIISPVFQHLGIYGYNTQILESFTKLPKGHYEQLEGLEQLRFLENGHKIKAIKVTLPDLRAWRGVDTVDDAKFVEKLLNK